MIIPDQECFRLYSCYDSRTLARLVAAGQLSQLATEPIKSMASPRKSTGPRPSWPGFAAGAAAPVPAHQTEAAPEPLLVSGRFGIAVRINFRSSVVGKKYLDDCGFASTALGVKPGASG